jgi:hypothetical protein
MLTDDEIEDQICMRNMDRYEAESYRKWHKAERRGRANHQPFVSAKLDDIPKYTGRPIFDPSEAYPRNNLGEIPMRCDIKRFVEYYMEHLMRFALRNYLERIWHHATKNFGNILAFNRMAQHLGGNPNYVLANHVWDFMQPYLYPYYSRLVDAELPDYAIMARTF